MALNRARTGAERAVSTLATNARSGLAGPGDALARRITRTVDFSQEP
ncbi:hypothetical protein BDK89_0271 [Ilumatobacter fluminis]|uniref:Uncharacterized protein n=1 Tax=Ilumatobacter fluminis TaxID=467091 RepID=A0A4R7HX03_9ACTN|nr:hypothetical protein BDK89_0271 [Ilumatobacter fluminis]